MKRLPVLVLTALTALHSPVAAQQGESVSRTRLSVTPLLGVRGSLLTDHATPIIVRGALASSAILLEPQRGSSAIAGAEADLRLAGRVGITGALLYSNADPLVLTTRHDSHLVSQVRLNGPSVWLARAGVSYQLPELNREMAEWLAEEGATPAGYLMVGPALIRQDFRNSSFDLPALQSRVDSWAVHVGYRAVFPLGTPNLALQAVLEDYVPFWNRQGEQRRIEHILGLEPGDSHVMTADFGYNRSHVPMLTVGLALRF